MNDSSYLVNAALECRTEIVNVYQLWADKRPIVMFHLQERKIYFYPYKDFKNSLSPRSKAKLSRKIRL
jgi:hypothetical protein